VDWKAVKVAMLSDKDTKARRCKEELEAPFPKASTPRSMFTQFADTMRFLRESLAADMPGTAPSNPFATRRYIIFESSMLEDGS